MKIILVLLTAYAIVGAFHSRREFYRGEELRHRRPWAAVGRPRHSWFICGLTWLPASITIPFMRVPLPPEGAAAWRRDNLQDSVISWTLFFLIVAVCFAIWGT